MSTRPIVPITDLRLSLTDLLGETYTQAVCEARAFIEGRDSGFLRDIADERVAFYPDDFQKRADELIGEVGKQVCEGYGHSSQGAPTNSFSGAYDSFDPEDVKYFNWRFIMRNNVDASPPISPKLDAFYVSYRLR